MNPIDAAMDPLRSAALTLHALPVTDRQWLLQGLSVPQRALLLPLLEELQALGVPPDPDLLQQLQPEDRAGSAAAAWPEALGAAEVATLASVLAGEPIGLTRSLLAIRPWRWTQDLLAAMDEGRRMKLREQTAAQPPSPVLQAAILQALRMRCEAVTADARPALPVRGPGARSGFLRWRGRV